MGSIIQDLKKIGHLTSCEKIILLGTVSIFLLTGCASGTYRKSTRLLMGTVVEVISDDPQAATITFQEVERLEKLLNKYDPQSEVARLNRLGKLKVSPDTLTVIKAAVGFYRQSNGAFDITVTALADIWKEAIKTKGLPAKQKIASARLVVGSSNIEIDEKNGTIKFLKPGMQIDLGGIAKGYAVDCAIRKLKAAGIKSCLINMGGNMYGLTPNNQSPWKVGLQHPRRPRQLIGYILLENKAIATSGDYEQYFETNGKRFSHIINPKTGYPADSGVVSVTVISTDATTCDALATAIFVLGKDRGQKLIKNYPDTEAIILTKEDINV